MKRRKFLKDTFAAGAGLAVGSEALANDLETCGVTVAAGPAAGSAEVDSLTRRTAAPKKVIVAGAGITGLCCGPYYEAGV